MATYLTLVNKVLRQLREKTVTSISQKDYSQLIGQMVNEAKEFVEDKWKWKALRATHTFSTVAGTSAYLLASTTERTVLMQDLYKRPMVFNTTRATQMSEVPLETLRGWQAVSSPANAQPSQFAQSRSSSGITLTFYPAPDAVNTMQWTAHVPQADLTADSDVLLVPGEPVWRLALAFAEEERGTGLGARSDRLATIATDLLADYIVMDAEESDLMAVAI